MAQSGFDADGAFDRRAECNGTDAFRKPNARRFQALVCMGYIA